MSDVKAAPVAQQMTRKMLGEILVERGLLTEISVRRMVKLAEDRKMLLGAFLENAGLITAEELADALANQFACRKIFNFADFPFPPQVLRMIPLETAVEHNVFPLKLDEGRLGLAVSDPGNSKLFSEIAAQHSVRIIPFVSTRVDISKAIAKHYLGRSIVETEAPTILLVEDDALISVSVTTILTKQGFTVETAMDGMEAFKKIFTCKPALVITDKVMPKLNGYEFLDAVRKIPEFKFTPVILMTAAPTPDEEKVALEKGFFDLILKPVKEIGLLTRVRRALRSVDNLYGKTG